MAETVVDRDIKDKMHVGEEARVIAEKVRVATTGSPFVSLRVIILLVAIAIGATLAPQPFAALAAVATVLLAFDIGRGRRNG